MDRTSEDLRAKVSELYRELIRLVNTTGGDPWKLMPEIAPLLRQFASKGGKNAVDFIEQIKKGPHHMLELDMLCTKLLEEIDTMQRSTRTQMAIEEPQSKSPSSALKMCDYCWQLVDNKISECPNCHNSKFSPAPNKSSKQSLGKSITSIDSTDTPCKNLKENQIQQVSGPPARITYEDQVEKLLKELSNGDAPSRRKAAFLLGNLGSKAKNGVDALMKALKDNDLQVKLEAALAIGKIGTGGVATAAEVLQIIGEPAIPTLIEAIKKWEEDAAKGYAWSALREIGETAVIPMLDFLKDEKSRQSAIFHLEWMVLFNKGIKNDTMLLILNGLREVRCSCGGYLREVADKAFQNVKSSIMKYCPDLISDIVLIEKEPEESKHLYKCKPEGSPKTEESAVTSWAREKSERIRKESIRFLGWWEWKRVNKYLRKADGDFKKAYAIYGDKFLTPLVAQLIKGSTSWVNREYIVKWLDRIEWKPKEGYPEETFYDIVKGRWLKIIGAAQNTAKCENQIWPLTQCYALYSISSDYDRWKSLNETLVSVAKLGEIQRSRVIENLMSLHPSKIITRDTFMLFASIGIEDVCDTLRRIYEKGFSSLTAGGNENRNLAGIALKEFIEAEKHKKDIVNKILEKKDKKFTIITDISYRCRVEKVIAMDENYVTLIEKADLGNKESKILLYTISSIE